MNKNEYVRNYNEQNYRTLEMDSDSDNPKALRRTGWNFESTNINIGERNMYAVVQEETKLVLDIDDTEFNFILEPYLKKTLIVKTGNGGLHGYFKDKERINPVKTCKLYRDGKVIGDIKAEMSYVIGCGCIYQENGITKEYTQISSTNKVMTIDFEEVLQILKKNNITTTKANAVTIADKLEDGLKEGERNNELFKTACELFEKNVPRDSVRAVLITINNNSSKLLLESEVESVLNSAEKRISEKKKQAKKITREIVEETAIQIMSEKNFVTLSKTNEILTWNGKIYTNEDAESYIKARTDQLVSDCNKHIRLEVLEKIKARTFKPLTDFDSNPDMITITNGILNLKTLELSEHTPENLSRILVPVEYNLPQFSINDESTFDDIEKNLKDILFWKFITSSFTLNGKLQKEKRETVLEILASVFIKHQIDQRGFIFLGRGDNGKSVFIEYIQSILGKENYSNETLHDLSTDRFAPASLLGKSANLFSDIESNELDRVGILKAVLAGEWISAQFKNGQKFKFNPFCKMLFSCNRFPKISDQTESFFRRWIIVKWERSFEGDPVRDEKLVDKLVSNQDEKNLVFSTIIHLSRKLYRTRKFTYIKKASDLRTEWNSNADPLESFIENWIITVDGSKKGIRETYGFYRRKMEEIGERPLNIRQFGREFEVSFEQGKNNGERFWFGIEFKEPTQTTFEE